MNNLIYTYV